MGPSNFRLATQAWLLILLTSSVLISTSSVLIDLITDFPLPPQWRLSDSGAIAVLLVSLGLLTILRHQSRWRYAIGGLLVVLGGYSLVHYYLLAPAIVSGLSRLSPLPASLVLIVGGVCLLPPGSARTRRLYCLIGWLSVGVGAATLMYPMTTDTPPAIVVGITAMGSVFCLLLGTSLLLMGRQQGYPALSLPRSTIVAGVLGVAVSITIWLASSWVQYHARLTAADTMVDSLTEAMKQRTGSKVQEIERLADRWLVMGDPLLIAAQQAEMRQLMHDKTSLKAFAYLGPDAQIRWRMGREPENLLWLMDQLTDPATLGWLRRQGELRRRIDWRFPDPERPSRGLLSVTSDGGQHTMLVTLDVAEIISEKSHLDTGGFTVTYTSHGRTWGTLSGRDWHDDIIPRAFASRELALPEGPTFTITALDGPLPLASLPGALPVIFGLLGLVFTYQLIISRALVVIRDA